VKVSIGLKGIGIVLFVARDWLIGVRRGHFTNVLEYARESGVSFAKGIACGLVAGQLCNSHVVIRGVPMHRKVLSRHSLKELSLQACAIEGLFLISPRCS
jgi:hypothetical protein